jgi:Reverse transcriptase (RNA-dependent DNA polymerase)
MAVLSERDGTRWHHLAGAIAETVEPRLAASVLANRATGPWPRWHPRPVGPALALARRLARNLPGPVLLRTDVAEFYPSVAPPALFSALRRLGVAADLARIGADLLEGWGSEGYGGLPIGPPASAVLANAVLASVDAAPGPHPFLRWVDDYLISVPDDRGAEEVLDRVHVALEGVGLRAAGSKTRLLDAGQRVRWLGASGG